ncbi:MAG TPA: hypothetical protein VGO73_13095 [Pyrinomonadaceae bacterium]|nr:hypothetical protein [Pyrinomonadaceae bacterium]
MLRLLGEFTRPGTPLDEAAELPFGPQPATTRADNGSVSQAAAFPQKIAS